MNKSIKENNMRTIVMVLIAALIVVFSFVPVTTEESYAATNAETKALGSKVQSYKSVSGTFTMKKSSRFYLVSSKAPSGNIKATLTHIDSEFAAKKKPSSTPLAIVYGAEGKSRAGDIVIKIDSAKYTGEQYKMVIGSKVVLTAGNSRGVFTGLRTLLKYRITTGSNTLARCEIVDRPDVAERTAHLDCARKYFSKTWIKNFIKKISWQNYNAIEIHFSEDQGMRLQSKTFPWLAGSYNDSHGTLSQSDMAEICQIAKKYHVEVIPSFDSPGHLNYMVEKYANYIAKNPNYTFKYKGLKYSKNTSGFKNISNYFSYNGKRTAYNHLGIDISNKTARAFTYALLDEYANFFKSQGCTKFNIGGDELLGWDTVTVGGRTFSGANKWYALQHWNKYAKNRLGISNGNARDAFISYMNGIAKKLEAKGYTCRVWNDEINRLPYQHVALKKSIEIVYWSNDYTNLSTLQKKGYKFYNAMSDWTYYVTKSSWKQITASKIYSSWHPKSFSNIGKSLKTVPSSQYGGAYFAIWCDYASCSTQTTVWKQVHDRMWASGVKMWNRQINQKTSGNGSPLSYTNFQKYVSKIGGFPGYSGAPTKSSSLPKASSIQSV